MSDSVEKKMRPDKPKRREKGIFGILKPKTPTFFTPNGEEWSSDDSDEDFRPGGRILAKKGKSESEVEAEADEITTPRKRKKPRKISRIESDDDQDGDSGSGKEDGGDSSLAASDSDESSSKEKEKKKSNRPTGVKRGKRRSYVEESNDSEEDDNLNRYGKKRRNVTRKSYVEESDDDERPSGKAPKSSDSINNFVVTDSDEEFAEETPSGDSGDEWGGKTNTASQRTKMKKKKKKTPTKRAKKIDLSSEDDDDYLDDDSDEYEPTKPKKGKSKLTSNSGKTKGTKTLSKVNNGNPASASSAGVKRCQLHRGGGGRGVRRGGGRGGAGGRGGSRGGGRGGSKTSQRQPDTSLGVDLHSTQRKGTHLTKEQMVLGWRWANRLPLHILVSIFQMVVASEGSIPFLLHAEKISPLWDSAASTAILWKRVDLTGGWANLDLKMLTKLCRNQFRCLAELKLPSFDLINEALPILATHCSSTLVSLGLPGCRKLKDSTIMQHIPHSFPNLHSIDLSDISEHHRNFLKPVVSSMGDKLVSLNISRNVITGLQSVIQAIISNCPSIEFLDMSNIHGNFKQSLKISQFQKSCPKLRTLRMAGMNIVSADNQDEISEMRGFPLLEDLSLAQTEDVMSSAHMLNSSYNQTLRLLLASSNTLKLLDIRGLRGLTASGLDIALLGPALNPHLSKEPQLQHLFWSGVSKSDIPSGCPLGSDMDFRQLLTSLRTTLLTLDLSQNIVSPAHLEALCAAFERGRLAGDSGPPLSDLNLASTNVEESHVRRLLASCDNLSSINLSGSRALPRDMKKLYQGDAFLELKSQMLSL